MAASKKIQSIPPYLFARIDGVKSRLRAQGKELIDLSIGDPDMPTPPHIIAALKKAVDNPATHRYPPYAGTLPFRKAASEWCKQYYTITLDPASQVLALIGSKEAIAHTPLAYTNPGDVVLIPSPGYPVYPVATMFADATAHYMPLTKENNFLPDYDAIEESVLKRARLLFINYPNNPTSAVATRAFFEKTIALAKKYTIVVAHDAAYMEIFYDGKRPLSILEIEGAQDVAIEFHSLSKTFNMTGWRLGFAVGNAQLVSTLAKLKTNIDSGAFVAVQEAGIAALQAGDSCVEQLRKTYKERRDILVDGLRRGGFDPMVPEASFYIWTHVPDSFTSESFALHLMEKHGIVATPGSGFGTAGEGFIRFSLTSSTETIQKAAQWLSHS